MINVITLSDLGKSYDLNQKVDGPQKVIDNLIKGLLLSDIQYSINEFRYEYTIALSGPAGNRVPLELRGKSFIGPQVWPYNNSFSGDGFKKVIAPSQWVHDSFARDTNIKKDDILIWPVGIDTEIFSPLKDIKKEFDCLIYFKRRDNSELEEAKKILESKNQTYQILPYGAYKQLDFLNLTRKCKYVFIINGSESQGIGYQELLSIGLPMFNWDIVDFPYLGPQYNIHCTSAPYWSDECGIKVFNLQEAQEKFDYFLNNIDNYNPREYIVNNLSLELQSKKLIESFENL